MEFYEINFFRKAVFFEEKTFSVSKPNLREKQLYLDVL